MDFDTHDLNRRRFQRIINRRPAPDREYCIYFTPRSGSSWLTDLAERSGFLGTPRECFNPSFAPRMAHNLGAADMDEYIRVIRHRFADKGTFGFEVTFYQLRRVFGSAAPFMAYFGAAVPMWLIREDIVAQAVSLWKMDATGISHSVNSSPSDRAKAEAELAFDADGIAHWLKHLTDLERLTEAHFSAHALSPLRFSYEMMMASGPSGTRAHLARHLGLVSEAPAKGDPVHAKIGTTTNRIFAERFRAERASTCAKVDEARAETLSQLDAVWRANPSG